MSATLHKILVHSSQIMEAIIISIGYLAEYASEAGNKLYKKDRIRPARKYSKVHNIVDLYHRAIDSCDPFISSLWMQERTNKS